MGAMLRRRSLLTACAAPMWPGLAFAERPADRAGPLRLGVDLALVESGLAKSLQHAFGANTGIAVLLVPGPALALLEAIKNGEVDAALLDVPEAEADLDRQGLVHDRQAIAEGEFILVGPAPPIPKGTRGRRPPPAGHSGAEALDGIRLQAYADPASLVFLTAGDGSGVHVAEQALWRAAKIAPLAPWYVNADPKQPLIAQARARGAYALVERGAWARQGGAPLVVLVEGDPGLVESIHAMRSFRVSHPAGKIFIAWIAGGRGRAVVAAHGGYRPT
jgi:tungstate transport system substrate-binding protein